jgi:hypothetical protein
VVTVTPSTLALVTIGLAPAVSIAIIVALTLWARDVSLTLALRSAALTLYARSTALTLPER